jgi:predicted metal-dependent hydrolase
LPWAAPRTDRAHQLEIDGRAFPIKIRRRRGARRYVVRVTPDGVVRLTVPYGAPIAGGVSFAGRQADWIAREWRRQRTRVVPWGHGTPCWFRGEQILVRITGGRVWLGDADVGAWVAGMDVRDGVTAWLRAVAADELPARCVELAGSAGFRVERVSVRNQRSRWGACSSRGSITLNWRLVQVPLDVRDYVVWHELAHLSVPNHSRRFWREVERLCASWREHERWLKAHEDRIMGT